MTEPRKYILGQSKTAARRLELQDEIFAEVSERLLDGLALRPDDRVVEFGCGPGSFSHRIFQRLGKGGVLIGFDGSEDLLKQARATVTAKSKARFETVLGDIAELGSWLDGATVVVGRAVLHHVPMVECVLGRLRARLRPGTRVGFLEPDLRSPLALIGYLEATGRPELAPLRIFATAINQLYQETRISPAVGATLALSLETAGYRKVKSSWSACKTDALMLENMRLIYDEVGERLQSLGLMAGEAVRTQQDLLKDLSPDSLPPVVGMVAVTCES